MIKSYMKNILLQEKILCITKTYVIIIIHNPKLCAKYFIPRNQVTIIIHNRKLKSRLFLSSTHAIT